MACAECQHGLPADWQAGVNQWVLDGRKFLSAEEIRRLKGVCQAERERVIINLGLMAGLRVKEIADLKCGDISLGAEPASLTVRKGKGGKMRLVRFNGELKESIMEYLKYKEVKGEGTGTNDPLLKSERHQPNPVHPFPVGAIHELLPVGAIHELPLLRGGRNGGLVLRNEGHLSRRTIQRVFERLARRAGISGHSFHHLRHTYASHLYRASNYNLRLVQKQLGHASIRTTQIYADVFDEDLKNALERLYK